MYSNTFSNTSYHPLSLMYSNPPSITPSPTITPSPPPPLPLSQVMQCLSSKEAACLIARVGWLKVFNPMKPEGSYALDLSRWEERIMAKSLCALVTVPPSRIL